MYYKDKFCIKLEQDLKKYCVHVYRQNKPLFDDIKILVMPNYKHDVISYIYNHYRGILCLRVNFDEKDDYLIYSYMKASKEKIENIDKITKKQTQRMKWLYGQIKDNTIFLKNVKEEDNE